jgi:hypothetical protein
MLSWLRVNELWYSSGKDVQVWLNKQQIWPAWKYSNTFLIKMYVSFICRGNRSTRRKPLTCHKSLTNFITYCCIEYTSPWVGFELTTSVVIGTDYIGSYKSNYHMITTTINFCGLFDELMRVMFGKNFHKLMMI